MPVVTRVAPNVPRYTSRRSEEERGRKGHPDSAVCGQDGRLNLRHA